MHRSVWLMIVVGVMLVSACADPAADKTKAVTGDAAKVASPATAAQGQRYVITPQNSKVEFTGSKVTGKHDGAFQDFSGQIDYAGNPEQSRVNITMKTDSLTTDTPDLTKHLKTPDFFDVAKFPEASFVSTSIKPGGEKGASHTVTGNLTLHGVTKAVTFPATISVTPDVATVDSTFSINRKDFGINYAGQADNLIRDDVVLKLTIKANKAS
ncbi:MAG TPA: YceI family protein [Pyrinomonadaceae bacterium]|nr:YceI family protein [Pyrinomonadaceae bacterium]